MTGVAAHVTFGRYEALHELAQGGMATVHLGRARGAGGFERLVAIKVMHAHIARDPSFRSMFLDEARLAARIRHPNVVPTLDVAEDGHFIVMEYVEGAALSTIIRDLHKKGKTLSVAQVVRISLDALAGLEAAHTLHDRGGAPLHIVHRDISPHNIMVGVDGVSRITDFGIAFAESRITSTRTGQLKGKIPYMAPEQLEDTPLDCRADVYAMGCCIWEMLTGKRLFQGSSEAAVACAVLAGAEDPPSSRRDGIPAAIDAVVMKALARQEERYPSAQALSDALDDAADALGIRSAKPRSIGALAEDAKPRLPALLTTTAGDPDGDLRRMIDSIDPISSSAPATSAPGLDAGPSADATSTRAAGSPIASREGTLNRTATSISVPKPLAPALMDAEPIRGSSTDPHDPETYGGDATNATLTRSVIPMQPRAVSRGAAAALGALALLGLGGAVAWVTRTPLPAEPAGDLGSAAATILTPSSSVPSASASTADGSSAPSGATTTDRTAPSAISSAKRAPAPPPQVRVRPAPPTPVSPPASAMPAPQPSAKPPAGFHPGMP